MMYTKFQFQTYHNWGTMGAYLHNIHHETTGMSQHNKPPTAKQYNIKSSLYHLLSRSSLYHLLSRSSGTKLNDNNIQMLNKFLSSSNNSIIMICWKNWNKISRKKFMFCIVHMVFTLYHSPKSDTTNQLPTWNEGRVISIYECIRMAMPWYEKVTCTDTISETCHCLYLIIEQYDDEKDWYQALGEITEYCHPALKKCTKTCAPNSSYCEDNINE